MKPRPDRVRKLLRGVAFVTAVSCGEAPPRIESTTCDACVIELRPVAELDFSDAAFMPAMFGNVEQLADGTFVVVDFARGVPEVLHFAADGRYIGSRLREGSGPGEVTSVRNLLAIGDSLLVVDEGNARCTMLDAAFAYLRDIPCIGSPHDAAHVAGTLFLTGFGPMGLVEVRLSDGERSPPRGDGLNVPVSDEYASLATGDDGVWFVEHPDRYRLTWWRPGESQPARVIERNPVWWTKIEPFLMTLGGRPVERAEDRQVMSGPLLFNVGVSDGLVWTASYVYTRKDRQYGDFLSDWLDQGLQGDVRVFIEALTPEGEFVASASFDDMAPPRFTSGGLLYTVEKRGDGTGVTVYRPEVVGGAR